MLMVEVCVGSSCHLKGSETIVEMMQAAIAEHHLDDEISLSGSFCTGKCNRIGVTVQVNDEVYPNVTKESFPAFFEEAILKKIE